MPTHYFNATESCRDYWIEVYGSASAAYKYLRWKDSSGVTITGASAGLRSAKSPGGNWDDDIAQDTYVSRYSPYNGTGAIEIGAPAADFKVIADGQYPDVTHDFIVSSAPVAPDDPSFDYTLMTADKDSAQPGQTVTVTLHVRDQLNRIKTTGGDTITAAKASYADADLVVGPVVDNGDGTYSFTLDKPTAGAGYYEVTINGQTGSLQNGYDPTFEDTPSTYTDYALSNIQLSGDSVVATLLASDGGPAQYVYPGELRMFSPDGTSFGEPTQNGNVFSFPASSIGPSGIIYCFYKWHLISGSMQVFQTAEIEMPRSIALQQIIDQSVQNPRAINLSQRVNDYAASIPSPGSAGAGWPKRNRFNI